MYSSPRLAYFTSADSFFCSATCDLDGSVFIILICILYFFCRLIKMEGDGFLTDILLDADDGDVAGLEELNTPNTQDTQSAPVVEPSRSTKGSKRTKKFHWKEYEVICSG